MNRLVKSVLFLIGVSIIYFLIRKVGFQNVLNAIINADLRITLLGVFFYTISIAIRSLKWSILVKMTENKIKYKEILPIYLVNSLMGNLTPFKSGETATPLLLKKYLKIPVGQGFSVIVLDRFFEILIFAFLLAFSILYVINAGVTDNFALTILKQISIILLALIAILILIITSKKYTLKIFSLFNPLKRWKIFEKILKFIETELEVFYKSVPLFKSRKVFQYIIPLTFLAWLFEALAFYFIFTSIIYIPFLKVVASQFIAIAATFVTFFPGGLGVAEGGIVYILKILGFSGTLILSGTLLARILLTGTLLVTGLIGSLFLEKSCVKNNKFK